MPAMMAEGHAGGGGSGGKASVNRALFPYVAAESNEHAHAHAHAHAHVTPHPPASPSGTRGGNVQWELGEGGDAWSMLKVKPTRRAPRAATLARPRARADAAALSPPGEPRDALPRAACPRERAPPRRERVLQLQRG